MADEQAVQVLPSMVEEPHAWRAIDYWQYPLWKCRRCKMQTKNVELAAARPCLPTKKGQCRVCHGEAMTRTALHCRSHSDQAYEWSRKHRQVSDDDILAMSDRGDTAKTIAGVLGVSVGRTRQIVSALKWRRSRTSSAALAALGTGAHEDGTGEA